MRRRLVWSAGIACAGIFVLLVAAALLLFAVSRGLGREALRTRLETEAAHLLGAPVQIEAIEGALFGHFALRRVRVGAADTPLFAAETFEVRFEAHSLLGPGPWQIESIFSDGLVLALTQNADRSWATLFDSAQPSAESLAVPALRIGAISVRNGALLLRPQGDGGASSIAFEIDAAEISLPFTAEAAQRGALELRLKIADAARDGLPVDSAELVATLSDGRFEISHGAAAGPAGRLALEGGAQVAGWLDPLQPASADFIARVESMDIGTLAGRPELASSLSGSVGLSLRKTAGTPAGDAAADLSVEFADLPGSLVEFAKLEVGYRSGRWLLSRCDLRGTGVELTAEGAGNAAGIENLALAARIPNLATFAGSGQGPLARGELQLSAEFRGAFDQLLGRASLAGRQLALGGVALGTLRAEISGDGDGRLRLETLALSGGDLPLALRQPSEITVGDSAIRLAGFSLESGEQRLGISGEIGAAFVRALRIEAKGLDVGALAALLGGPAGLGGRVDTDLEFDGGLPAPSIDGQVIWSGVRVDRIDLESVEARIDTRERSLHARVSIRDAGREVLAADAVIPYAPYPLEPSRWLESPETSLSLRAEAFDLHRIGPFLPDAIANPAGRLDVDVEISGGPTPEARGTLALQAGAFSLPQGKRAFESLRGEMRLEPHPSGIGVAAFVLESPAGALHARGASDGKELYDVHLEARGIDASLAAAFLDAEWGGVFDLDLSLRGPVSRPQGEGRMSWREPGIGGVSLDAVEGDFAWDDAEVRASIQAHSGATEIFRVEANGPISPEVASLADWLEQPGARLDLRGDDIELALLQPFVTRRIRDLRGRATIAVGIRGGAPKPSVRGSLDLEDGSFRVPLAHQTFAPVTGHLTLTDDALEIDALRVGSAEKGAGLSGRIEHAGFVPISVDLRTTLRDLPLARSPALTTDVNGSIQLTGPIASLALTGEVELRGARASLREEADSSLKEIRVLARTNAASDSMLSEDTRPGEGAFEHATVDLRLRVPRNSWLRGGGTELELQGDLTFRKGPLQPAAIAGRAEVVRGTTTFQSKRFDVRKGSATFDGGTAIDPILDIEAAHPVRDVTVLLFLTGRSSAPKLRIGSEPAMSESDALAYLFLGRPANQLRGTQRAGIESAATALAAGVAAAQVSELLTGALPIDSLDVSFDETGQPNEVKVGKYVTDRIFVRYGRTLGPEPEDEVRMELRLDENWSVGSDVSTDDNAGADLIWSLDY